MVDQVSDLSLSLEATQAGNDVGAVSTPSLPRELSITPSGADIDVLVEYNTELEQMARDQELLHNMRDDESVGSEINTALNGNNLDSRDLHVPIQWSDIFADDSNDEFEEHLVLPSSSDLSPEMSFKFLFGDNSDKDNDNDVTCFPDGWLNNEKLPAISMEDIFGCVEEPPTTVAPEDESTVSIPSRFAEVKIHPTHPFSDEDTERLYISRIPMSLHFENRVYKTEDLSLEAQRYPGRAATADNVVRWRRMDDGSIQSNARVVEWDNGDTHLFVGREVYDISKHFVLFDNVFMFERTPDGAHTCHHKFSTSMHVRTCLQRKSKAAELIGKRIQNDFHRKYYDRELKMTLTGKAARQPPTLNKDITMLNRRRESILRRTNSLDRRTGVLLNEQEDARDVDDLNRLSLIKQSSVVTAVRRKRGREEDSSSPLD